MRHIFKLLLFLISGITLTACHSHEKWMEPFTLQESQSIMTDQSYANFSLSGQFMLTDGAEGRILFHTDGESGYTVLLHNGEIDGTRKTGSLASVRNLYRSLAEDNQWFNLDITVRGKNIAIAVNGTDVVCYTEPEQPFRTEEHAKQLLGEGKLMFCADKGTLQVKELHINALDVNEVNPNDTLPAIDEQNDDIIRLQQMDFPVIDYHVHLKGGLTKEQAHAMSMNYGINYGVAPNAGEGGVGRMLADDEEVISYLEEVKPLPFLCGVQGEGRRWTQTFSPEALNKFSYLFTDAMTIIDHKQRNARLYHEEEVHFDGVTPDQYVERIVEQLELILTNEPADFYANPFFLPKVLQADYESYWTESRVNRVLDILQQNKMALEINPRYLIPSMRIIKMAKERGLKFIFGTNNKDADFGKLEYCMQAIKECGITADDIWFPSMSIRKDRKTVVYNDFDHIIMQY